MVKSKKEKSKKVISLFGINDFNNPKISSFSEFEPDLVPGKLGQVLYEALRNNTKKRIKNAADFADRLQWAKDS